LAKKISQRLIQSRLFIERFCPLLAFREAKGLTDLFIPGRERPNALFSPTHIRQGPTPRTTRHSLTAPLVRTSSPPRRFTKSDCLQGHGRSNESRHRTRVAGNSWRV